MGCLVNCLIISLETQNFLFYFIFLLIDCAFGDWTQGLNTELCLQPFFILGQGLPKIAPLNCSGWTQVEILLLQIPSVLGLWGCTTMPGKSFKFWSSIYVFFSPAYSLDIVSCILCFFLATSVVTDIARQSRNGEEQNRWGVFQMVSQEK